MLLMPNTEKYKWLLQGKGSQIQISNKAIVECSRRYGELLRPRVIMLDLIQLLLNNCSDCSYSHMLVKQEENVLL